MKGVWIALVVVLLVASIVADYLWRRWMADRKRDRE